MSTEEKVSYTKLKTPNKPIVKDPKVACKGTVIGLSDHGLIIRKEDASLVEIILDDKELYKFRNNDIVQFSEHGVLTEHQRKDNPKPAPAAPRSGCTRIPANT